jgi:predicted ATPase
MHAASLCQYLREPEKARQIATECLAVCDEHGAAQERAWVMFAYGWAIAELGQVEEGISQIRASLDAQLSIGGQIARPQFLTFLAEIYCQRCRAEEGLKTVEEGLAVSKANGDRYYDAELLRLQGEFFNMQDKIEEAESCFHRAIEIARQQAAKSLELRACTSLARLWQKNAKRKEAQRLLSETHSWFTEGFDTADLKESASLLKELS